MAPTEPASTATTTIKAIDARESLTRCWNLAFTAATLWYFARYKRRVFPNRRVGSSKNQTRGYALPINSHRFAIANIVVRYRSRANAQTHKPKKNGAIAPYIRDPRWPLR